jgi:hypothetical protein
MQRGGHARQRNAPLSLSRHVFYGTLIFANFR